MFDKTGVILSPTSKEKVFYLKVVDPTAKEKLDSSLPYAKTLPEMTVKSETSFLTYIEKFADAHGNFNLEKDIVNGYFQLALIKITENTITTIYGYSTHSYIQAAEDLMDSLHTHSELQIANMKHDPDAKIKSDQVKDIVIRSGETKIIQVLCKSLRTEGDSPDKFRSIVQLRK